MPNYTEKQIKRYCFFVLTKGSTVVDYIVISFRDAFSGFSWVLRV